MVDLANLKTSGPQLPNTQYLPYLTSADAPAHGPTYPKGGQLGIFSMFFGWIVRESIPVPHFIINKSNDFLREYEMLLFSKCSCFSIRGNMLNPRGAPGAAKGFGIRFFSPSSHE